VQEHRAPVQLQTETHLPLPLRHGFASYDGCFLLLSCWAEGLCALRSVFEPSGCVHLSLGSADSGWVPDLAYLVRERGSQLGMWLEMCSPTWPILQ
jgi:hypothetical protein